MKIAIMMTTMALAVSSLNAMTLAEARGKTDAAVADPSVMTGIMKQLSAADQKSFIASVNEAVGKLPGSAEEKSAKALNINRAALKGAAKGNAGALIAEIFATAPVESLAVLNESFAKDILNRSGDPSKTYSDEKFSEIASNVVSMVNARVAGSDDAGVRGGFAAIMMVRASNGSPESLAGALADMLGDSAEAAKSEWFPAALATPANYDPMIAQTDAEKTPDIKLSMTIAGPQRHASLVAAVGVGAADPSGLVNDGFGDWAAGNGEIMVFPRTMDDRPWNPNWPRGYPGQTVR